MIDKKMSLSLKSETVERLKQYRLTEHESLNNVIMRLLIANGGDIDEEEEYSYL